MAKKKPAEDPADESKWLQVNLRLDDPRLLDAIDKWAATNRRSRNMAMILLMERSLHKDGYWPPATADSDD